jgi:hypothetical protein
MGLRDVKNMLSVFTKILPISGPSTNIEANDSLLTVMFSITTEANASCAQEHTQYIVT